MPSISENFHAVRQRIHELEQRCQRPHGSVSLLAVSKTQAIEKVLEAWQAGARDFGENYLQEALEKIQASTHTDISWHFIGPVQSNKTREIAAHFDWVHSVDRFKIAKRLDEQRPAQLGPLNVCVQVNLSGESSKSGVALHEVKALCKEISLLEKVQLRGLMAIPAPCEDFAEQCRVYRPLHLLFQELAPVFNGFDTLSIGMSADYEAAISEGSTMVRIGTALFGNRAS